MKWTTSAPSSSSAPAQNDRGGDAIDVVVAVDRHPILARNRAEDALDRRQHVVQGKRVVRSSSDGDRNARASDGRRAANAQQPRGHGRDLQLASTSSRRLVARLLLPDLGSLHS
jgi:hypothetical protein